MMIDPPSVPSAGAYVVVVRSTSPPPALAEAAGASEVAGCDAAGADADGDGLAAVPHAANTTTAPASNPTRRFRINAPPTKCVSPHLLVADLPVFSPPTRHRLRAIIPSGARPMEPVVRGMRSGYGERPASALRELWAWSP